MKKKSKYRQIKSIDEVLKLLYKQKVVKWINSEDRHDIDDLDIEAVEFYFCDTPDKKNIITLVKTIYNEDWKVINGLEWYYITTGTWFVERKAK